MNARATTTRARDISLRSQLIAPVLAFVRERGGDADRLRRDHALPGDAETAPEVRLPLRSLHDFFEAAETEARDPCLGLHVAQSFQRGRWGVLEFCCRNAPTARDALARVARYLPLLNEHVIVTFEVERDGTGTIAQHIPGRPECLGRHGNEFFATAILTQLRALSGRELVPVRAFFAHRKPAHFEELSALFGRCPIEFGADRNGLSFARDALDASIAASDPQLLALLDAVAQKGLEERPEAGSGPQRFAAGVRTYIRAALAEGTRPALADAARTLRISERTFQRRLAEEDTTFADLLDSLREELARAHVRDRSIPLGGIAFLLGYAELKPFVRAFRRWTGQSPGAYRSRVKADTRT